MCISTSGILVFQQTLFLEQRPEIGASAIVRDFLVHAEGIPGGGTEDLVLVHIVHTHGNTEHGAEGDEICTSWPYMPNVGRHFRTWVARTG